MPKYLLVPGVLVFLMGTQAVAQEINEELAAQGARFFRQCQVCHQIGPNAQNLVGPRLNDIVDRTAGTVEGYSYSDAMAEAGEEGLVWTEENLMAFLADPQEFLPDTKMIFAGLPDEEQRAAVIEHLKAAGGTAGAQGG